MGKIKRQRILRKRQKVIRDNKPSTNLNNEEEVIKTLPPFILDKIPSQMNMRPNAQTMRAMMMQRFAPPYIQMPFSTPQQQQAQNLKNNNDIKEQAITQSKQDLIVEQERKRSLQRQEAEFKREHSRLKHDIADEKQELNQQIQMEDELKTLKRTEQQLQFDKEMFMGDNKIRTLKKNIEAQQAVVEQLKFENKRLQQEADSNELQNKFNQIDNELKLEQQNNEALRATLTKLQAPEYLDQMRSYIESLAKYKAENNTLHKLQDMTEKAIQGRLEAIAQPSEEQINREIDAKEVEMKNVQKSIVEQMNANEKINDNLNRLQYVRNLYRQNINENEKLKYDQEELKLKSQLMEKLPEDMNEVMQKRIESEFQKNYLTEELKAKQNLLEKQQQTNEMNIRAALLNSPEYKSQYEQLAILHAQAKHNDDLMKQGQQLINKQIEANHAMANQIAQGIVIDAQKSGDSPIDRLQEELNDNLTYQQQQAVYEQMKAHSNTVQQEESETQQLRNKMLSMFNAIGEGNNEFRAFIEQKYPKTENFLSEIQSYDKASLEGIMNDFKGGPNDDNDFLG